MTVDEARTYIKQFTTHTLPGCTYVELTSGRIVDFAKMSDKDAILVATILQRDIEAKVAEGQKIKH